MTALHQIGAVGFANIKKLYEEDLARIEELKRQLAEEKRCEQQRKAQARRLKQEEERQKAEAEKEQLRQEFERVKNEYASLLADTKSGTASGGMKELEASLRTREERLVHREEELKGVISQLRVDVQSQQKVFSETAWECGLRLFTSRYYFTGFISTLLLTNFRSLGHLVSQEYDENLGQRDATVFQISQRAARGGENARKAIESLQGKFEEQDEALSNTRESMGRLAVRLDAQAAILDMTYQQHHIVLTNFNQLLREQTLHAEAECTDRDRQIRELEVKYKALVASSAQELREHKQVVEELGRKVGDLQQQQIQQQQAEDRLKADHDKSVLQLKSVVQQLETEVSDLTRRLDTQKNIFDSAKSEHVSAVEQLQQLLVSKDTATLTQRTDHERKVKELDAQLKSAKQELQDRGLEQEETMAQLRQQLRSKEMALQNAHSERESLVTELSNKVDRGEAEAAAQMRVQMRTQELQLEDANSEVVRLSASLANQNKLVEINKEEKDAVIAELQRMLAAKDDVGLTRHTEHEKIRTELESRVRQVRTEMDERATEYEDKISNLRQELRQKDRRLQTELAEQEAQITDAESRVRKLQSELEARGFDIKAKQMQLETKDGEVLKLQGRLCNQETAANEAQVEAEKSIAELQRYLQEHRVTTDSRATTEAAQRAELDRQIKALETQLQAEAKAAVRAKEDHSKELSVLLRAHEEEMTSLERTLSERSDLVAQLKDSRNAAEEQSHRLQEELNLLAAKYKETQDLLHVASKDLEQRVEADRAAREDANKAQERLLQDMNAKLNAQSEKVRAQFAKLGKAIRAMSSGKPGSAAPGEGTHVDLKKYMHIILSEEGVPPSITLGRFQCKGELHRAQGKAWQKRWGVLDLQAKHFAWFVDHREMRISMKGSIPLYEITEAKIPPGTTTDFLICTAKRDFHVRAPTAEAQECWVGILIRGRGGGCSLNGG